MCVLSETKNQLIVTFVEPFNIRLHLDFSDWNQKYDSYRIDVQNFV